LSIAHARERCFGGRGNSLGRGGVRRVGSDTQVDPEHHDRRRDLSILAIAREKARIGIEAPCSVPVFRSEVYVEIREKDSNCSGVGANNGC
jgi:carbon storage regulator CsrA